MVFRLRANSIEEDRTAKKIERQSLIRQSDWIVLRHLEELQLGKPPSLLDYEWKAWTDWREYLRLMEIDFSDPASVIFPEAPDFLSDTDPSSTT